MLGRVARKPLRLTVPGADYGIRVIGHRPTPLRDFYHAILHLPWTVTFAVIAAAYLTVNAVFAAVYLAVGGVAHAASGSFVDAFFFSVQTMGTIGYGAMFPESRAANVVVVTESLVGLVLTALATGLVFAKFSRPTARLVFSRHAVISPVNGRPTLSFRMGNERGNAIVDAQIRLVVTLRETTAEGNLFYRMHDLRLARDRALSLARSWAVMHPIDADSPLAHATPDTLARDEAELQVLVVGLDDTTMQPVHGRHGYYARDILFGARHVDVLSEADDGDLVLDLRRFHDVEPTAATPEFPYPRA
jgi:inward rectifier potassium channel